MRVFLACPLTQYLETDEETGEVRLNATMRHFVVSLECALHDAGHTTFLAHRHECFGAKLRAGNICTPFDLLEMQRADCVVAMPSSSYGVHIELGWSAALNKPIILLNNQTNTTPLLSGLSSLGQHTTIPIPPDILSRPEEFSAIHNQICCALDHVTLIPRKPSCAFLTTGFGFGPVSKAVTIAEEIRRSAPEVSLHYFGARIDYDYAIKSAVFDRIFRIDVDDNDTLQELVPLLQQYDGVIDVLNLDLLTQWAPDNVPLYFVDSLSWMWPTTLLGISNARVYFVQNYLMQADRLARTKSSTTIKAIPPIIKSPGASESKPARKLGSLLVNFSGSFNPFIEEEIYERYVDVLSEAVLDSVGDKFNDIIFACNARLAERLHDRLGKCELIRTGHYGHDDFLQLMATSELVLSTPGITTTLEALSSGSPLRYLLPQNYSQALISEKYSTMLGERMTMAFSRFGSQFVVQNDLPEQEGVQLVSSYLRTILTDHRDSIISMISDLLSIPPTQGVLQFQSDMRNEFLRSGQRVIADYCLNDIRMAAAAQDRSLVERVTAPNPLRT